MIPAKHIAGITPTPFGGTLLEASSGKTIPRYSADLQHEYDEAQHAFAQNGHDIELRGQWDQRVSWLNLRGMYRASTPTYSFLVNETLLRRIVTAEKQKGTSLTQDELCTLALAGGDDAVCPDFTTDAMNAINASYYASSVAFDTSTGLADMFVTNRPLNNALGNLMAAQATIPRSMRIKELAGGPLNGHWEDIANGLRSGGVQNITLTLTDFIAPKIEPRLFEAGLTLASERYSLFDTLPHLDEASRYDIITTSYGLDSVWQPEDICYRRLGTSWYQYMYRVKVADWSPRQTELLTALRARQPLDRAKAKDYDGTIVETAMEPVDLTTHPYGRYITSNGGMINFPGGLIARIVNAFETQLKHDGICISADTGNFRYADCYLTDTDRGVTGIGARYRADDYKVAKQVFEEVFGFEVTLMGLDELAEVYLVDTWYLHATEVECAQLLNNPSNGVMIVKRRQTKQAPPSR